MRGVVLGLGKRRGKLALLLEMIFFCCKGSIKIDDVIAEFEGNL